ncbi:AIF_collapsed_G0010920.mRNA.1.CDS.1 [Saccharomyces cerevisiae]|nr:AIF_collapsed_G0010920.mRNA.1.CDS.1 [Saccharomyces cerevisiae]
MNDIKTITFWNGELNVLGSPREIAVLRIRVPRETYLVNYMPFIWNKIKSFLSFDPLTDSEKYFWFEHNKTPIPWNYPVGVLF